MRILWASKGWHSNDRNIVEGLAKRGHDVALFSLAKQRVDWDVPVLGGQAHALLGPLIGPRRLRAACAEFQPEIVFGNFVTTYGNYAARGTPREIPVVAVAWGSDLLLHGGWPIVRLLTQAGLRGSRLLVSNAEHLAEAGRRLGAQRVELLPYGIDTDLFRPGLAKPSEWPECSGPVIVCTRSLKPLYDHETLLRGFAASMGAEQATFIIIGAGPERSTLEQLATDLGVAERVVFTGQIDNRSLPHWLSNADIWVSGARSDGLPLSMLEAMASGLKVVVGELPLISDWTVEGTTWTFQVGDSAGFARSLDDALQAPGSASPWPGRQLIEQKGSLAATVQGFERLATELSRTAPT